MPLYFAYGSNLKAARLADRVGAITSDGAGTLPNHRLSFRKRGADGSGKACCEPTDDAAVWGVLYLVDASQLAALDVFEAGYQREIVRIHRSDGRPTEAITYRAERLVHGLSPFDWYKSLLLQGAREHALPDPWIDQLRAIPSRPDLRAR